MISVISKCTSTCFGRKCLHFRSLRCITIWKVKVIDFLISFIAAVRTVVVQLVIFLVYWSGAKNNLLPGILNLFHRLESMRTLRICKCILHTCIFYTHNALAVNGGVLMWHWTLALLVSTHLGSFSRDEILSWRLAAVSCQFFWSQEHVLEVKKKLVFGDVHEELYHPLNSFSAESRAR